MFAIVTEDEAGQIIQLFKEKKHAKMFLKKLENDPMYKDK